MSSLTRAIGRATSRTLLLRPHTSSSSSAVVLPSPPPPPPQHHHHQFLLSNQFHSLSDFSSKAYPLKNLMHCPADFLRFGFSSTASSRSNEKENGQTSEEDKARDGGLAGKTANADETAAEQKGESGPRTGTRSTFQSFKRRRVGSKRTAFSDSDSEGDLEDLPKDELVKLVLEKEELIKMKQKEIAAMQDKVLQSYAEMENVMDRTRREAENSKKFAIQGFAKSLLDVADNLGRASSTVRPKFARIDESDDTAGAVPLLKTLLEGVEMTEKQLSEVFKKFGVEKFDPADEQFDPNRHNAMVEVLDHLKPPGTVAVVLKSGYMLHDRIIRPAEVGVTPAAEANRSSKS